MYKYSEQTKTKPEPSQLNMDQKRLELLVHKRVVPINGNVNSDMSNMAGEVIASLLFAGAPDIYVLISSSGGDVEAGLNIFDLLENYPGKKTGIVFKEAGSMAAIILQACDERIASTHADILIHHISRNRVSLDVVTDTSGKRLEEVRDQMIATQNFLYAILCGRTKKTIEEIKRACSVDKPMLIEEALKFGLVDRILTKADMAKIFSTSKPV